MSRDGTKHLSSGPYPLQYIQKLKTKAPTTDIHMLMNHKILQTVNNLQGMGRLGGRAEVITDEGFNPGDMESAVDMMDCRGKLDSNHSWTINFHSGVEANELESQLLRVDPESNVPDQLPLMVERTPYTMLVSLPFHPGQGL